MLNVSQNQLDALCQSRIEVLDDQLADVLRAKTPAQRVEMIFAANRTARLLAAAGARYEHPDWDESLIQAEIIKRVSGGAVRLTTTDG